MIFFFKWLGNGLLTQFKSISMKENDENSKMTVSFPLDGFPPCSREIFPFRTKFKHVLKVYHVLKYWPQLGGASWGLTLDDDLRRVPECPPGVFVKEGLALLHPVIGAGQSQCDTHQSIWKGVVSEQSGIMPLLPILAQESLPGKLCPVLPGHRSQTNAALCSVAY